MAMERKNNITKIPINGRTGNWTGWHENGVKWSELSFKNGKKHGVQKNWYDNGQKELQGEYEDGKPVNMVGGILMVLQCKREIQFRGKFEGLYFINPQVPTLQPLKQMFNTSIIVKLVLVLSFNFLEASANDILLL